MKPFAYLEGMVPEPDAPEMDNPARLYCPQCREKGQLNCDDPGFCGNLRPMKPKADPDAIAPASAPNPPPPLKLDDSAGQEPLQAPQTRRQPAQSPQESNRPKTARFSPEEVFPDRLMGKRTTITQLPDGEEKSWDWFMENLDPEKWK